MREWKPASVEARYFVLFTCYQPKLCEPMRKVLASVFLLCCFIVAAGQMSVVTAKSYSFSDMVRQLKERNYEFGYSPRLAARIPSVDMEISPSMSADSILRLWLTGLKFTYHIDEDAHHVTLLYKGDTSAGAS